MFQFGSFFNHFLPSRWHFNSALRSGKLCIAIYRRTQGASDSEGDDNDSSPFMKRSKKFTGSISSSCSALSTSSGMRHSVTDDDERGNSDESDASNDKNDLIASKVLNLFICLKMLWTLISINGTKITLEINLLFP